MTITTTSMHCFSRSEAAASNNAGYYKVSYSIDLADTVLLKARGAPEPRAHGQEAAGGAMMCRLPCLVAALAEQSR